MDSTNPVIQLCIKGSLAEACQAYVQAWETARDDEEKCIAAHYYARCFQEPAEILHWNLMALQYAELSGGEDIQSFYPSLYLNLGYSYELVGKQPEAERFYALAAQLGAVHQPLTTSKPNKQAESI